MSAARRFFSFAVVRQMFEAAYGINVLTLCCCCLNSKSYKITFHAIYNLLIAYGGAAQYIAYALPVLLVAAGKLSAFRLSRMK